MHRMHFYVPERTAIDSFALNPAREGERGRRARHRAELVAVEYCLDAQHCVGDAGECTEKRIVAELVQHPSKKEVACHLGNRDDRITRILSAITCCAGSARCFNDVQLKEWDQDRAHAPQSSPATGSLVATDTYAASSLSLKKFSRKRKKSMPNVARPEMDASTLPIAHTPNGMPMCPIYRRPFSIPYISITDVQPSTLTLKIQHCRARFTSNGSVNKISRGIQPPLWTIPDEVQNLSVSDIRGGKMSQPLFWRGINSRGSTPPSLDFTPVRTPHAPLRYLFTARDVDTATATPTDSAIPTPTSSTTIFIKLAADGATPYLFPSWVVFLGLALFVCLLLTTLYWVSKQRGDKQPVTPPVTRLILGGKFKGASRSAESVIKARAQTLPTIALPPPASTAAVDNAAPGSEDNLFRRSTVINTMNNMRCPVQVIEKPLVVEAVRPEVGARCTTENSTSKLPLDDSPNRRQDEHIPTQSLYVQHSHPHSFEARW
ncbi:hypothetical protein FB451DRAFT_1184013 [Mycena latifolia]|nr:hypothetical protein FB451DRAFT_1184013 [Mycena latifolia]